MTTTPPLRPIVEPPTPLHGARHYLDDSPKSPNVRKSARLSHRLADRTPSPTRAESKLSPLRSGGSTPRRKQLSKETMLPTPVKTPRKDAKSKPSSSTARVLFPTTRVHHNVDEAMPRSRKRSRIDDDLLVSDDRIEIFTDSKEKVPQIDESADNPFYVKPSTKSTKKKSSKATKPAHNVEVQNALEKDDGMVYVFRGKKLYRKFEEDDEHPEGDAHAADGLALDAIETPRRFTRSSVKPRLLFPQARQQQSNSDDEAPTDIEDQPTGEPELKTPTKSKRFLPVTPPDTNKAKRTTKGTPPAIEDEEPVKSPFTIKKAKRPSSFAQWQRKKAGSSSSTPTLSSKRRTADTLEDEEGSKRVKT